MSVMKGLTNVVCNPRRFNDSWHCLVYKASDIDGISKMRFVAVLSIRICLFLDRALGWSFFHYFQNKHIFLLSV